jgi:hypothetical protein
MDNKNIGLATKDKEKRREWRDDIRVYARTTWTKTARN